MKTKAQKRIEAVERAISFYESLSKNGHGEIDWSAKNGILNTISKLQSPEKENLGKRFDEIKLTTT